MCAGTSPPDPLSIKMERGNRHSINHQRGLTPSPSPWDGEGNQWELVYHFFYRVYRIFIQKNKNFWVRLASIRFGWIPFVTYGPHSPRSGRSKEGLEISFREPGGQLAVPPSQCVKIENRRERKSTRISLIFTNTGGNPWQFVKLVLVAASQNSGPSVAGGRRDARPSLSNSYFSGRGDV